MRVLFIPAFCIYSWTAAIIVNIKVDVCVNFADEENWIVGVCFGSVLLTVTPPRLLLSHVTLLYPFFKPEECINFFNTALRRFLSIIVNIQGVRKLRTKFM